MRACTGLRAAFSTLMTTTALGALLLVLPAHANAETGERVEIVDTTHSLSGSYLAGRFARSLNDTELAAAFYGNALVFDPASDMLLEQALLMEASFGAWDSTMRIAGDLVALEPNHRMAHMFLGLGDFKSGSFAKAEEHFKAASSGPIGELTSALAMAWIKLAAGDTNEALNLLVVPKQAEWAQFYLRYHRALLADVAGRRGEAKSSFERVFKQDARTLRTALAYARSLSNAGDAKGARSVLRVHLEKTQSDGHPLARALADELGGGGKLDLLVATPADGIAEVFYGLGESLIGEGAVGIGIVYLQMALYVVPDHPFALAALANAYEANKQYSEAIAVYDRIPKGSPLGPAIEIRKAFNLNSLDRPDEARDILLKLIDGPLSEKLEEAKAEAAAPPPPVVAPAPDIPDLGTSYLQLGSTGDRVRQLQSALAALGYNIGGEPDGAYGDATRKAVIAFQREQTLGVDGITGQETFSKALTLAAEKAPGSVPAATAAAPQEAQKAKADKGLALSEKLQALDALGNIQRSRKLYADAITTYDRAIGLIEKPDRRHWAYFYARGTSHERNKDWPKAESDLKRAMDLYPDQPLVLNYLGYSWIDQGVNLDQGMSLIERAVALKPDDGYIVDSLGWAHFKRGNFKEAVRYLERAVELRPDDPVLNDHLGDALWRVGREREAKFQWDQALSLKPEPEDETKIRKKLSEGLGVLEKETRAEVIEQKSGTAQ
ncbi:MAG: tetratricopeptide repeat protein [Hyphomicrobium sp.]|nr:tetratricopeptide repeat protein [Hyphomicrobium sp.]